LFGANVDMRSIGVPRFLVSVTSARFSVGRCVVESRRRD
jgi:hypothetical protein